MTQGPPFRAEHVGSLLRPEKLLRARAAAEGDQYRRSSGPLNYAQLKEIEDEAIRDVVRLQEDVGLQVVTDGEFRRRSWFQDFILSLTGTDITFVESSQTVSAALPFQDDVTIEKLPGHIVQVRKKLAREKGIFTEHFAFLKKLTKQTPKVSLPSPSMLHFWGGRAAIDATVYPDIAEFWDDAVDDLGRRDQGSSRARLPLRPARRRDVSVDLRSERSGRAARARRRSDGDPEHLCERAEPHRRRRARPT